MRELRTNVSYALMSITQNSGTSKMTKTKRAGKTIKLKRKYLSQSDIPAYPLDQAARVAQCIADNFASAPTNPLHIADALEMSPSSSHFRQLLGAAIAFGLTSGGYNANEIALTDLGRRATKPLEKNDDATALREALLKPRVMKEFLSKYDNSPVPAVNAAKNVLENMDVPNDRTEEAYALILNCAKKYGLTREIKGKTYIDLSAELRRALTPAVENHIGVEVDAGEKSKHSFTNEKSADGRKDGHLAQPKSIENRHVFIAHGKNKSFTEPIKKLLAFSKMTPVLLVEKQPVSKPLPEKVMNDMRQCSAAIIHVHEERKSIDDDTNEVSIINPNILIEIGAAMALYGKRFILLVQDGVKLPSNLQGLYEVRYDGSALDCNATIRLLKAINDIKNNPLPKF